MYSEQVSRWFEKYLYGPGKSTSHFSSLDFMSLRPFLLTLCATAMAIVVVTSVALVLASTRLANVSDARLIISTSIQKLKERTEPTDPIQFYQVGTPFATSKGFFSIIYQHYRFVVDGPSLIKKGYEKFPNGLFEIPRTFRFGQVVLCKLELIEELKNLRSTAVSPEPWIDQVGYAMLY